MGIKTISAADVFRLHQESGAIAIVDVRESDEFAELSSPLAENFPLSTFDVDEFKKSHDLREQIFLLCRSGRRSLKAAQILEEEGYDSLYNIEGGMIAWEESGLPIVKKLK